MAIIDHLAAHGHMRSLTAISFSAPDHHQQLCKYLSKRTEASKLHTGCPDQRDIGVVVVVVAVVVVVVVIVVVVVVAGAGSSGRAATASRHAISTCFNAGWLRHSWLFPPWQEHPSFVLCGAPQHVQLHLRGLFPECRCDIATVYQLDLRAANHISLNRHTYV